MNYDFGTIVLDDDSEEKADPYQAGRSAGLIYRGVYENIPSDIKFEERQKIALELTVTLIRELFY